MTHYGESGLQEHSVGDLYPGGDYIIAGKGPGGTVVAWNLVTGEEYGRVKFEDWDRDFKAAYDKAIAMIPPDVPYRKRQRQHVAVSETSTDVACSRRNVMSSPFAVPAEHRILSDEFISRINSRRILCELIAYYEGIVEKNVAEFDAFVESDESGNPRAYQRAQALIDLNRFVLQSLIALVEAGNRQVERIQELTPNPLEELFRGLGIGDAVEVVGRR